MTKNFWDDWNLWEEWCAFALSCCSKEYKKYKEYKRNIFIDGPLICKPCDTTLGQDNFFMKNGHVFANNSNR